jgi:hypothetical protein
MQEEENSIRWYGETMVWELNFSSQYTSNYYFLFNKIGAVSLIHNPKN